MDAVDSPGPRKGLGSSAMFQESAIDVIDWDTIARYVLNRAGSTVLGVLASLVLLLLTTLGTLWMPVLGSPAARCGTCLGVLLVLQGSEAVPTQASAFLPIFLLHLLQLPCRSDALIVHAVVLCELAAAFLVLSSERTTAVDLFVLRVLQVTGTRMRTLAVLCATVGVFCSCLMDTNASVLVVGALITAVVRAIQDDVVQGYHQRALFDKATRLLPAIRRRQLENMLWPQRLSHGDDDLPPEMMGAVSLCESPLLSVDMTEGASFGESTEEALWDFLMYNTEFNTKAPRAPKHSPPAQPAYPTRSSLWDPERAPRSPKCTSFLEDGAVVLPGKDSPLPKRGYGNADESILRVPIASLFAQGLVRDVMFWETRRYVTIFQDLLLCAVNASVIVSYIALYTNDANRYFVEYLHSRYGHDAVNMGTWWSLLTPMMVVSSITWWQSLSSGALHDFDAPLQADAQRTIKVALRKQLNGYRNLNNWQVASVVVFLCWVLRRSYPFVYNLKEDLIDNFDVLTVDFVMVLVALALPASSSRLLEAPTREYANLWFRLPWTALLTLGCSGYMAEAVRTSDVVGWLTQWAPRSAQYKFVTQLLLTLGAAVLTELVGRKATVSVMMPVIMDIAAAVPCNPLYLCIPVTVAASTTLLLPTSSFAMAYVYDRLAIGPWDLVFCGLMLKLVSIVATILTVSTLGNFIFHWNHIPDWFSLPATPNTTGAVVGHQQG